jgi:hypothetical protein
MVSFTNPLTGSQHNLVNVGMDLYNLLRKDSTVKERVAGAAGVAGTAAGLPEWGVSEVYSQGITPPGPTHTPRPSTVDDGPGSSSGSTSSTGSSSGSTGSSRGSSSSGSSGSSSSSSGGSSKKAAAEKAAEAEKKAAAEAEAERIAEWEKEQRGEISSAYDDIFSQLDALLGQYPGQKQEMLGHVDTMADAQRGIVESERARGVQTLEGQRAKQQDLAKSSLRNLEEDIRNSLTAAGRYLGVRGAGDSSAAGQMSEALAKAGQKARSGVLQTRDQAIAEIGQRISEVGQIASEQLLKVDQFKAEKALDIANFFQSKIEALEAERRSATAQRGQALANIIQNTQGQFIESMRALDAETRNYKQSIDMWQMQRAAEMEDYASKLALQESYSGASSADYGKAVSIFDTLVARGVPVEQAREIAMEQGNVFLPEGMQRESEFAGLGSPSQLVLDAGGNLAGPYGDILGGEMDLSGIGKVDTSGINLDPFSRSGL